MTDERVGGIERTTYFHNTVTSTIHTSETYRLDVHMSLIEHQTGYYVASTVLSRPVKSGIAMDEVFPVYQARLLQKQLLKAMQVSLGRG